MAAAAPWASDPALREFVAGSPINRGLVAQFVAEAAASLPSGARVLDAGAGTAPYRPLFAGLDYVTSDWTGSMHPEALDSDIVAPLDALPVEDGAFDAVVATEVLEHVADPRAVLRELRRVLTPGGGLWLTVPFVWELHEEPYDYFRYTRHALALLLAETGFAEVAVRPLGGYFSTLGQLLRNAGSITGRDTDASLPARAAMQALARIGPAIARLDRVDRRRGLPLGYAATARKPA